MKSRLSALQHDVLRALVDVQPPWVLTGGAALAGFHLGHRTTEDLDLFFFGRDALESIPQRVKEALAESNLPERTVQQHRGFHRLSVEANGERVLVDLVAEPVPQVAPPVVIDGITVDSPHEVLVNKLCALLSRTELRDLYDVQALVDSGEDLKQAIRDAPRKDGGFSPATLAWVLQSMPLGTAERLGFDPEELQLAHDNLVSTLLDP